MRLFSLLAILFFMSSCGDKVKKAPVKLKKVKINLELKKSVVTKRLISQVRKQGNILLLTDFVGNIGIRDLENLNIRRTVKSAKGRVFDFVSGLSGEVVLFIDGRGRLNGFNLKNGIFLNIGDNLTQLSAIASHPIKNKIVLGTRQGELVFLDNKLQRLRLQKTGFKKIKSLSFSAEGDFLLVAGFKKDLLIFKTGDWSLVKKIRTSGPVTSFAFSKNKKYFSVGTIFWKVTIYKVKSWRELVIKEINLEPVTALTFSEDSSRLYAGYGRSGKGEIAIFHGTNFSQETLFPIKDRGVIFLSSQGKKVLAVTSDGNLKLYK